MSVGQRAYIFWKKADGTEGTSVEITTDSATESASVSIRISGGDGDTNTPEYTDTTGGSNVNPDPPNLTPAGGSDDYLWVVMEANTPSASISSYPSGYSNTTSSVNAGEMTTALCARQNAASSENPGTFTISGAENWMVMTIAVYPEAVSDVTVNPSTLTLTTTEETPTYFIDVTQGAVGISASLLTPFLPVDLIINPSTLTLTTTEETPTYFIDVTQGAVGISASLPTHAATAQIEAGALALSGSLVSPDLILDKTVSPETILMIANLLTPRLDLEQNPNRGSRGTAEIRTSVPEINKGEVLSLIPATSNVLVKNRVGLDV